MDKSYAALISIKRIHCKSLEKRLKHFEQIKNNGILPTLLVITELLKASIDLDNNENILRRLNECRKGNVNINYVNACMCHLKKIISA